MRAPDSPRLDEWEKALSVELADIQKRRDTADRELQRVSRKLELVRQMRALEETSLTEPLQTPPAPANEAKPTPSEVRETAARILAAAHKPLHISEIHRLFLQNGYAIPGQGTAFNILAHLVNDKGFVRVARGTYALAGSVPEDKILQKAARRQRRKKRRRRIPAVASDGN